MESFSDDSLKNPAYPACIGLDSEQQHKQMDFKISF